MLNKYIKYTFYDDDKKLTAIVNPNIPKEVMQELKREYKKRKLKF